MSAEIAARSRPGILVADLIGAISTALAGHIEDARRIVAQMQVADPSLSIRGVLHLQAMQPAALARWVEGLRLAGVPE